MQIVSCERGCALWRSTCARIEHVPIAWIYLVLAIVSEVFATASLRAGVDDPVWNFAATAGYIVAFALLGLALREGMAVGSAYAIWGALGVVLTSFIGIYIFAEPLSVLNWVGIAAIVIGVVLVEGPGSKKTAPAPSTEVPS